MNFDAATLTGLGVLLSGALAGVAAIMNARKQRSTANETELRGEIQDLAATVKLQRRYIGVLYAYAVRLYRRLIAMGVDPEPEPVPDEETP